MPPRWLIVLFSAAGSRLERHEICERESTAINRATKWANDTYPGEDYRPAYATV